ncbi:MAG TPA: Rrf2 family transcriptional regulator [Pseudobdellovibrionaceae bacterium]|nr:Rrf2 family transcriptional regulator [Pseudobdellovibrionaceae bacterium]
MNRINRKVEYALMALRRLAGKKPGELTTAKEVSDTLRTPFDATARVMQIMANRGLLRSEQGATGGYQIQKDLESVSLLDLAEMIDGPQHLTKCFQKSGENCEIHKTCNIATPLSSLNRRLHQFYGSISLKELLFDGAAENPSGFSEVNNV